MSLCRGQGKNFCMYPHGVPSWYTLFILKLVFSYDCTYIPCTYTYAGTFTIECTVIC